MNLANRDKVESYREAARRVSTWMTIAMLGAAMGYVGALGAGQSHVGWYCFVAAVACSFWVLVLGIHTQEQEQTAALLEYMLELDERNQSANSGSGA